MNKRQTLFFDYIIKKYSKEWKAYTNHPFALLISNGSLSLKAFKNYIFQDMIYLKIYAKCWKTFSNLTSNKFEKTFAEKIVDGAIKVEMNYHKTFQNYEKIKIMRITKKYISLLKKLIAKKNSDYLFFGLIACFAGYAELGKFILNQKINSKFNNWINTYISKDFVKNSEIVIKIANKKWTMLNENDKKRVEKIFLKTVILEKAFFDQILNT